MFRAKTLPRHGYPRTTYAGPPTNITYCAFEDAGEEWQVLRVGPFVTRGDNHSVDWLMDKAFRPDENARTYVTDSFSAILDEHGITRVVCCSLASTAKESSSGRSSE